MRTRQRLEGLKAWVQRELCAGREMKAPVDWGDMTKFVKQEPRCYLGWPPMYPDRSGKPSLDAADPKNVCPGIQIMPYFGYAKYVEEQRFDRYNKVHRPQEMGQDFRVQLLFSVWEPGIRLPGFADSTEGPNGYDLTKLMEGTEQGIFTLVDWMDDCLEMLLAAKIVPGTDLFLVDQNTTYTLFTDESWLVDKRPLYYGFVTLAFKGYANEKPYSEIDDLLS